MDKLHFPARDVPPYGEYVQFETLEKGKVYFTVHYVDNEMTIPEVMPLVFIGRNLGTGDVGRLYFQDASSYRAGIRFGSATDDSEAEFHVVDEPTPFVYEFERALDRILHCSLTRQGS